MEKIEKCYWGVMIVIALAFGVYPLLLELSCHLYGIFNLLTK